MSRGSEYKNLVLISQVAICVMVPLFLCLAIGIWLDNRFGTWFTLPLLAIGMAAGGRNAYTLVMDVVKTEDKKAKKQQRMEIERKVKEAERKKEAGQKKENME